MRMERTIRRLSRGRIDDPASRMSEGRPRSGGTTRSAGSADVAVEAGTDPPASRCPVLTATATGLRRVAGTLHVARPS
jgi:hypothetical protein